MFRALGIYNVDLVGDGSGGGGGDGGGGGSGAARRGLAAHGCL